jgi:micrococcal nuclease
MWTYKARVVHIVDGDTFDLRVDLGFYIYHQIRVRLRGVDTPEVFGPNAVPEGKIVSQYVRDLIEGEDVIVTTYKSKPTTFGRWEADVQYINGEGELKQLGEHLVDRGFATKVSMVS